MADSFIAEDSFIEETDSFQEEPTGRDPYSALSKVTSISNAPGFLDRLTASAKRKIAIFQKAGLEGLTLDNITLNDLPLWTDSDISSFTKQATKVEPRTTVEKIQGDVTKFGYSLIPMHIAGKLVGWGKVGLTKPQIIARTAAVGGILGGAEKPEEEGIGQRAIGAVKGAVGFAAFTAGAMGLQHILSQYSNAVMKRTLDKAMQIVAQIEPDISAMSTMKAYETLQSLTDKERNIVMNILRGKHGMPQKEWKSWFEKNIGGPAYEKFIDILDHITPPSIKEALVYRGIQRKKPIR